MYVQSQSESTTTPVNDPFACKVNVISVARQIPDKSKCAS